MLTPMLWCRSSERNRPESWRRDVATAERRWGSESGWLELLVHRPRPKQAPPTSGTTVLARWVGVAAGVERREAARRGRENEDCMVVVVVKEREGEEVTGLCGRRRVKRKDRLEPMCWDKAVRPGPNLRPNTACAHHFAINLRKTRGRSTDKPLTRRPKQAQPRNGIYRDARTSGPSGISGRSWHSGTEHSSGIPSLEFFWRIGRIDK